MGKYFVGIDLGSTTAKVAVLDEKGALIRSDYARHGAKVKETVLEMLKSFRDTLEGHELFVSITGSAGFGVAESAGINFIQEVFATAKAVNTYIPDADAVIELGGEDAKILFLTGGLEERMNGSCAGGTGAFIDQMATLLNVPIDQFDDLAAKHDRIYPIASRCGVFAKSDIQPLLNQGARKEDLAASVLQAVVSQTVSGLAQGREIKGKVVFLGGPLFFFKELGRQFVEDLKLDDQSAVFPENSQVFVAIGAAIGSRETEPVSYEMLLDKIEAAKPAAMAKSMPPLFADEAEYEAFKARHASHSLPRIDPKTYEGGAYLGIDAGSTTTKLVLITEDGGILYDYYASNKGNPVSVIKEQLYKVYDICGDRIKIKGSGATGYGETLIQSAFGIDRGCVETIAHFLAAKRFLPEVDYILDIGGQDIKCFKIRNDTVDSIMLNEACSSGCGSFIETYASTMGYTSAEFAKLGLLAKHPVNLGSRCTVFMNSSIKQAQREGAGIENISAGLSYSVVKNVMYKVIRAANGDSLGKHIVVQGGTFLNDAVLRAFELEVGRDVVRPAVAGIMGAYGAALYAQQTGCTETGLISREKLDTFTHTSRMADCKLCGNGCHLTINIFDGGRKLISGNRCDRPNGISKNKGLPNMFAWKYEYLTALQPKKDARRGRIGMPMGLNIYETLPFWHTLFTALDFELVLSPKSTRQLYVEGQHTIPSDTVCYPAKLMHGHIEALLKQGLDVIFYPCLPYNINEKTGDNHYNCPVVAYYPELIHANMDALQKVRYLTPYCGIHRPHGFEKRFSEYMHEEFGIPRIETVNAVKKAYTAYHDYLQMIKDEGARVIAHCRAKGIPMILLAGRPYHIDPEINHGIDSLINSLGCAVITEDSVYHLAGKTKVHVLNQWTYHSRLYAAAKWASSQPDIEIVQLVSFGCGIDAITTDEMRDIVEGAGRIYTQLKIDEINNLSAVKIRLRSLLAAVQGRQKRA